MKCIVYLTTNTKSQINGLNRIYVGVHRIINEKDMDPWYIGCGINTRQPSTYKYPKTPFQYAVKKYGIDAFKREILYIYDSEIEAYNKEHDIVNEDFIKQSHVYNVALGGAYEERFKPLYQFDLEGNLVKKWDRSIDASEFYGYPITRWSGPKKNKCIFLDSYWSTSPTINVNEYSKKPWTSVTYLYNKDGKMLMEFESQSKCAEYINYDKGELSRAIKNQTLIKKQYYVSDKVVDEFKPASRRNYIDKTFYIYTQDEYIGEYKGKEVMNIIDLHSWDYISHIFTHSRGWYKDFYLSLEKIDKAPIKRVGNGICVDIYDKYGNYIETLKTIKEVKEKYKVPSSKLKNIQYGDKYFENYIFKYSK